MTDDNLTSTAQRTLRLAELLLDHPEGYTPQELLLQLNCSRSTLFMLLSALKSLGYVEQSEKRGRYRLGARLAAWRSAPATPGPDLVLAFYQESSRQTWGETLAIFRLTQDTPLALASAETAQIVRTSFTAGQLYPQLEAVRLALEPAPPAEVRANGYALCANSETLDLALPICRDGRTPEAALLFSAPAFRWETAALLKEHLAGLRAMAARLSYRLGAANYAPYQPATQIDLAPAVPLTPAEIDNFLQGPWTARLACIRPDGRPHVIPVWQEWDGAQFWIVAWHGSQWAEYVAQNPNVSLTIDEPWPPLRRVTARGLAVANTGVSTQLVQRLSQRYLGQATAGTPAVVFRIRPEALRGWQGLPTG